MSEPFNCPFCGSHQTLVKQEEERHNNDDGILAYVQCHSCGSRGPWQWFNIEFHTLAHIKSSTIEKWNERVTNETA